MCNFVVKKGILLEKMLEISDAIDSSGHISLADIMSECMESVSNESYAFIPMKLKQIGDLLDKNGLFRIAEDLDDIIPDVLELNASSPKQKTFVSRGKLSADAAYSMVKKFNEMYLQGEIDESSYEYSKMNELKNILKSGFLLPPPKKYKKTNNVENWWDHFSKGENNETI